MIELIMGVLSFCIGYQVWIGDIRVLICHRYHYSVQFCNLISAIALLIAICLCALDIVDAQFSVFPLMAYSIGGIMLLFVMEFIITILNLSSVLSVWSLRFLYVIGWSLCCTYAMPLFLMGFCLRHSPFGIPYMKTMSLAHYLVRRKASVSSTTSIDWAYAGDKRMFDNMSLPIYDVCDYGVLPDINADQTDAVQRLIDEVGSKGGGIIHFHKGRYVFRNTKHRFLQINHSNIIIEGEKDSEGRPITELVSCMQTSCGKSNPWLSPFFITTGENIQPSNVFFGLQFRHFKSQIRHSSSLSDPGSDGHILTPEFVTNITHQVRKGDTLVKVESSRHIGKYIMIGLYNTTADGNLLKDILGIQHFRPEWTTALRAGDEEAPSYQWLVEVANKVDDTTIELVRPALRDFEMDYQPVVYNVEMLENICVRDLKINSCWNGQFHHHGFPLYYSVARSQEMDYGWNAINMKRVAHGRICNVKIENFTNPLYLLDSRNITVSHLRIEGHDGHQGIKLYQHACDNLVEDVEFTAHFADMMGGEGNAYGNVFDDVHYLNPVFNPVDFDFHGFSEGPMSPPSDNIFCRIRGFRYIKSAGARHMLPGCAQRNMWMDVETEGEMKGGILFLDLSYRPKRGLIRILTACGYAIVMLQKQHKTSLSVFRKEFIGKLRAIDASAIPVREHYKVFPHSILRNVKTWADLSTVDASIIDIQE